MLGESKQSRSFLFSSSIASARKPNRLSTWPSFFQHINGGVLAMSFFVVLLLFQSDGVYAQPTNPAVNVWAWGRDADGECDVPSDLTNAVAVSAGTVFSMGITADGRVVAWGYNGYGQCNIPNGMQNPLSIGAGGVFAVGVRSDGTVLAWGNNNTGECDVPTNLSNVVSISATAHHTLALRADGTVAAWGDGGGPACVVPQSATNVAAVAAADGYNGGSFSLALRADGTVVAWGDNSAGQCNVPIGLTNVVAVAGGNKAAIAAKSDGNVVMWGDNSSGQRNIPSSATNVVAVSAGQDGAMVALKRDGSVVTWGGGSPTHLIVPNGLPRVAAISAGGEQTLALVNLDVPSVVRSPPSSQIAPIGSTILLTVRAVGRPPLRYQWFFEGNPMLGATNPWLSLTNLQTSQSGTYTLTVTNDLDFAISKPAVITVLPGLDINMVPAITLRGTIGQTYRLDYINKLGPTNAWTNLATLVITNNPQLYFDVSAIGQAQRLYRLVQVP